MNDVLNEVLEEIVYFPSLRTQLGELRALRELDKARKRRMLPVMTLMPTGRTQDLLDFRRAAQHAGDVMQELPHLIDLGRAPLDPGPAWRRLADPAQGFRAWRDFAQTQPAAIPMVQLSDEGGEHAVTLQAARIQESFGLAAFRLRGPVPSTALVERVLQSLGDSRRALVVLDFGTEREWLLGCAGTGRELLARWKARWPALRVVAMGNSFPATVQWIGQSPTGAAPRSGRLAILERELHRRLGGVAAVGYGDHAAIHVASEPGPELPPGLARIDYPWQGEWRFERRRREATDQALREAAQAIVGAAPGFGARGLWGEHEIQEASNGRIYSRGREAWTAVRVNLHLATQVDEMIEEQASYTRAPCAAGSPSSC